MANEKRVTVWMQRYADRPHYLLQWVDPDTGRRRSETTGTADAKEAEQKRHDKEYELNHGLHQDRSNLAWDRFREMFEAEYVAARRPNTRENYSATLNIFERLCHPKKLKDITERTLSQFAMALRQEPGRAKGTIGQMPSTIRQRLQLLRKMLVWAVDQRLIPAVPKIQSIKVPKKRPQPVPAESFERLLAKAPDANMRAYLLAGWLAGLRLDEAYSLEWEATDKAPYVDLLRSRIILPAEFVKAAEDQWVPLDPALREAMEALPPPTGAKVFRFVTKAGRAVCLGAVGERVIRLAKKAGVKLTMHSLRKGFLCRYANMVPAQVLQRLARHASIQTTMGFYANVDAAVEEAVLGPQHNRLHNKPVNGTPVTDGDATQAIEG